MPKIVDHDERRQELIDALFRVIEAQGPHAVSTRSVASEAGVSKSNIGHYFESQAAMLSAALDRVVDQTSRQASALLAEDLDQLVVVAMQAIPDSAARRLESELWLLFVEMAGRDETMARVLHELNARIEGDILAAVSALEGLGILRPGLDPTLEAKRLHALIDGLSLRTMTDPTALTLEEVRQIVRSHLAQITTLA